MLAALSTGHEIGLAVVGAVFIGFALWASFVAPNRWPDFPGPNGLGPFAMVSVAVFAAMIAAVAVFGQESEAAEPGAHQGSGAERTIKITESEYRIALPALQKLPQGKYTFVVENAGKIEHNLVIEGGNASGPTKTALIRPGATARLTVSLSRGNYTLYCSVDSHRQQGMSAVLNVG
ncbi:MAG TPA: hypothetical protein VFA56_15225 [Gaiellaceae bacterium]|nr:hypothetical protein [Gaiellaceae bacterium]